ncbi:hypothetical protein Zm00014a_039225 [Zea mays]|uniref:Uncharacterized protein n=1 Tax=Zea mays TaxID=4577 RepID=A0A3L6F0X2_MAIZE|nr:hypothetical protein Zm00014a_039225 [Zea mays]
MARSLSAALELRSATSSVRSALEASRAASSCASQARRRNGTSYFLSAATSSACSCRSSGLRDRRHGRAVLQEVAGVEEGEQEG